MSKHLWEYDNKGLFEVRINHLARKPYYESWDDFIQHSPSALKCNCTIDNHLVWWYWDTHEDDEDTDQIDTVNLIYGEWFSGVSMLVIKVKKSDESLVKDFIKQEQKRGGSIIYD